MWTYFIQGPPLSPVKIGRTSDVAQRLQTLQTGSPHELRVLLAMKGDREQELHTRFKADKIRGEWFRWSPGIRDLVSQQYSDRPQVWSMVNAYCTESERREFNEWKSTGWLAADELRDWVRLMATIHNRKIPKQMDEVIMAFGEVPALST